MFDKYLFDKRNEGVGIFFVCNGQQPIRYDGIKDRDIVMLHIAEAKIIAGEKIQVSVQVRDVKKSDSHFKGVINGFEPTVVLEHKDLKIEDEVEFEEQHIISCCGES